MSSYVMIPIADETTYTNYFLTGPFPTDTHALMCGEKYDDWQVVELDDPGAKPEVFTPAVWVIEGGHVCNRFPAPAAGEPGAYILYPTNNSHTLIGPFADMEQMQTYIDAYNLDDDPRWYGFLFDEPPGAPRVEPAPPIPDELVQQYLAKEAKEAIGRPGVHLDTRTAMPDLTTAELVQLQRLEAAEHQRLAPDATKARDK